MSTITFGINSGPVTASKDNTISDADVTRLLNALKVNIAGGSGMTNTQLLNQLNTMLMGTIKRLVVLAETQAQTPIVAPDIT